MTQQKRPFRVSHKLHRYELAILRTPGEKFFVEDPAYKSYEGIDEQGRTVWVLDFEDQFAVLKFLEEYGHRVPTSQRDWSLFTHTMRMRNHTRGMRLKLPVAGQKVRLEVGKWMAKHPQMPPAQAIHRVLQNRRAGYDPDKIDYRQRAERMHERYQLVQNEFQRFKLQQSLQRMYARPIPPTVLESKYTEALRVILEQFVRSNAAALGDVDNILLYAVGPRYDLNQPDPVGLLNALQYFGADGKTAVEYMRAWFTQHYYGGAYERNFCLYEFNMTREPVAIRMVMINNHSELARCSQRTQPKGS